MIEVFIFAYAATILTKAVETGLVVKQIDGVWWQHAGDKKIIVPTELVDFTIGSGKLRIQDSQLFLKAAAG